MDAKPHSTSPQGAGEAAGATSLRDAAYLAIKHRIITGYFKPGAYLNEATVCSVLNIGRTPVHQALNRLMLEGMVEMIPRKGVIVKPVNLSEILEIIDVRLLNEVPCARLAAERASGGDIEAMDTVLREARAAAERRDVERLMLLDRDFHEGLRRAAKNATLGEVLRNLQERSLRFWFISLNMPSHHIAVCGEHEAILEAVRRRDPQAAEAAMREHIESFRGNILQIR